MLGELFQFNMFPPSNGNIPFLRIGKKTRKYKASCLFKGRFPVFVRSPEVWEHLRLVPLPQENTQVQEPPHQQNI
jgi:hypothetical protein